MFEMRVIKALGDLPDPQVLANSSSEYVIDFETDSGIPSKAVAQAFLGAKIAQIGIQIAGVNWIICTDRMKRGPWRLETAKCIKWLGDFVQAKTPFVRRAIAHYSRTEQNLLTSEGIPFPRETDIYCTEIACHHYDDRRMKNSLDVITKDFLGRDESSRNDEIIRDWLMDAKLSQTGNKRGNYAEVPSDMMCVYLNADLTETRLVYDWFKVSNPRGFDSRAERIDMRFNKICAQIEHEGIRIHRQDLMIMKLWLMYALRKREERLSDLLTFEINPMSPVQLKKLLIDGWGLPVLRWTKAKDIPTPSFEDDTLDLYAQLPGIVENIRLRGILELMQAYREERKSLSFIIAYLDGCIVEPGNNGKFARIHTTIHPCRARGGRTTSARPNLQQVPAGLHEFMLPDEGCGFLNADASQVEYRWMAHIMCDEHLIRGYRESRSFDVHEDLGKQLQIKKRRVAKVINFGIGFNMGSAKLVKEICLAYNEEGLEPITALDAEKILMRYYDSRPNLKPTRRAMEAAVAKDGSVKNFFGFRSKLIPREGYKAFNRYVQGGAAHYVKEQINRVDDALYYAGLSQDAKLRLLVHDEGLWSNKLATAKQANEVIITTLENFQEARVPMWWEAAWSTVNWGRCGEYKDAKKLAPVACGRVPVKTQEIPPWPAGQLPEGRLPAKPLPGPGSGSVQLAGYPTEHFSRLAGA